jgi:uncharacterized protein YvpB
MCPAFTIDDQQVVRHIVAACPNSTTATTSSSGASTASKGAAAAQSQSAARSAALGTTAAVPLAPPYHSQFDGSPYAETNCGPTSLSMALGALNINVDQLTLRKLANVQLGTTNPNSGTTWASLIYAAQKEGVSVTGPNQSQSATRSPWSIADIVAEIAQGHPVILLVRYQDLPGNGASGFTSDHYIVAYGVDAKGNLIYNDPAFRNNGGAHLTISPDALTKAWTGTSEGLVRTAIALSK